MVGANHLGRPHLTALLLAALAGVPSPTHAGQVGSVIVTLTHPEQAGTVGCALFPSADGFPNEPERVRGVRVATSGTTTTCTFEEVAAGTYAVAAFLDTNGNEVSDRNFVGMPTEPWGVSNNVRHRLRAPRFDEAAVALTAGQRLTLEIRLAK